MKKKKKKKNASFVRQSCTFREDCLVKKKKKKKKRRNENVAITTLARPISTMVLSLEYRIAHYFCPGCLRARSSFGHNILSAPVKIIHSLEKHSYM